jgi:YbbR domain-containing protein
VTITVEIEPILTTDTYNRTVEVVGLPPELDAIVRPEQVRVVLFGPLPALDALPEEDVRVSVDVFGLEVGTYTIEPTVDIPDRGIDIRSVQPSAVSVTLTPTITTTAPITNTVTPQSLAPLLPIQVGTGRSAGNLPPTRDFAAVICYLADAGGGVTRYNGPCSRRQIAR